jgi:general secretion pathway protein G
VILETRYVFIDRSLRIAVIAAMAKSKASPPITICLACTFLVLSLTVGCATRIVVAGGVGASKVAAAKADISTLTSAVKSFELDCGRPPTTSEGLDALSVAPTKNKDWKGPYLSRRPPLDPWGHRYDYAAGADGPRSFTITSYGSDGAPGGNGEAADIAESG